MDSELMVISQMLRVTGLNGKLSPRNPRIDRSIPEGIDLRFVDIWVLTIRTSVFPWAQ
jgi:hypothetical protein